MPKSLMVKKFSMGVDDDEREGSFWCIQVVEFRQESMSEHSTSNHLS